MRNVNQPPRTSSTAVSKDMSFDAIEKDLGDLDLAENNARQSRKDRSEQLKSSEQNESLENPPIKIEPSVSRDRSQGEEEGRLQDPGERDLVREEGAGQEVSRRSQFSNMLGVEFPRRRAKSPVTVQEWVAALPDIPAEAESATVELTGQQDVDNLRLGAEAEYIQSTSTAKPLFKSGHHRTEKRNLLMHSDTNASLNSEQSNISTSSVDSLLQSREVDPEEVLINLGFAGNTNPLSRIPARFFRTKSKARGINIGTFLKNEAELEERFQSGYFGYRGLVGNSSRRPSEIVEKIIDTLREREREVRRKNSAQSWSTSSAAPSHIPARFRIMDPNRPTFESIVEQITQPNKPPTKLPNKPPTKSFKSIAKSVLSPENREWREDQSSRCSEGRRRLHLGGKYFLVDDDGNEVTEGEEEEEDEVDGERVEDGEANNRRKLVQQDSMMSLSSTISVESDWSDDEREELEKIFGVMSEKGEEYAKLRQLKRMRRKSRRKGSSRMSGSGAGTPSTVSWDGTRLVYSRESSLSEITASSIDLDRAPSETGLCAFQEVPAEKAEVDEVQ